MSTDTPLHIGIIGCSAEGASLCYRTICAEAAAAMGPHAHPEITMHTPSLALYVAALEAGDLDAVGALMAGSSRVLAGAGADFLICPDNTIHQALPQAGPLARPLLSIADAVADSAQARGLTRLGLLGTRWLVESDVYPAVMAARGIAVVRPDAADRATVDTAIFAELVPGRFDGTARAQCRAVIGRLKAAGCDGIVLGCTELPLVLGPVEEGLPTLDSTRLLARAALAVALRERSFPAAPAVATV
ncbi:MAG: aspartate/glutamate racemase family protein [Acuticoccus sp.]